MKCTQKAANKSFQAQVLANLVVLEDDKGETSMGGLAVPGGGVPASGGQAPETAADANQMVVYKGPAVADGKAAAGIQGVLSWLWSPGGDVGIAASPSTQHQDVSATPSFSQFGTWLWGNSALGWLESFSCSPWQVNE